MMRYSASMNNTRKPSFKKTKQQRWRNMDIEQANESLLKKMVNIVNVSFQFY